MRNLPRCTAMFLAVLCLLSLGRQAKACSCQRSSLEERLAEARHVALVEITEVRLLRDFPPRLAHFRVLRSFKGRMGTIADLRSGTGLGDCGAPLRSGQRYLIYLEPGSNYVSICYGVLGPWSKSSLSDRAGAVAPAVQDFFDGLVAHLQQGAPLVEPSDELFEEPSSHGGPPPPPPPEN